jgi:hypothetical protein
MVVCSTLADVLEKTRSNILGKMTHPLFTANLMRFIFFFKTQPAASRKSCLEKTNLVPSSAHTSMDMCGDTVGDKHLDALSCPKLYSLGVT